MCNKKAFALNVINLTSAVTCIMWEKCTKKGKCRRIASELWMDCRLEADFFLQSFSNEKSWSYFLHSLWCWSMSCKLFFQQHVYHTRSIVCSITEINQIAKFISTNDCHFSKWTISKFHGWWSTIFYRILSSCAFAPACQTSQIKVSVKM